MSWEVRQGDCLDLLRQMDDCSVDSVVCDPPYGLEFMGKEWDRLVNAPSGSPHARQHSVSFVNPGNPTCRNCGGLKSLESEGSGGRIKCRCSQPDFPNHLLPRARAMQDWHQAWATECLRVLKPGGHLLAFGGTRTYHRLACGVEDAGFEIRDTISWMYGSGFPKSLDVSKAIDKGKRREYVEAAVALGVDLPGRSVDDWTKEDHAPGDRWWESFKAGLSPEDWQRIEREVVGETVSGESAWFANGRGDVTAPATPEAERWQGWGTALKPAHEPIVVARKPLAGTVASNVLEHGVGALNIDGCRVGYEEGGNLASNPSLRESIAGGNGGHIIATETERRYSTPEPSGRWPANVALSHTEGCVQVGVRKVKSNAPAHYAEDGEGATNQIYNEGAGQKQPGDPRSGFADPDGTETVGDWSCSPDCPVRLLDEQTGELAAGGRPARRGAGTAGYHGWPNGTDDGERINFDSGGASRFFYVAKASRAERNAGLEDPGALFKHGDCGGVVGGALRNSHPT